MEKRSNHGVIWIVNTLLFIESIKLYKEGIKKIITLKKLISVLVILTILLITVSCSNGSTEDKAANQEVTSVAVYGNWVNDKGVLFSLEKDGRYGWYKSKDDLKDNYYEGPMEILQGQKAMDKLRITDDEYSKSLEDYCGNKDNIYSVVFNAEMLHSGGVDKPYGKTEEMCFYMIVISKDDENAARMVDVKASEQFEIKKIELSIADKNSTSKDDSVSNTTTSEENAISKFTYDVSDNWTIYEKGIDEGFKTYVEKTSKDLDKDKIQDMVSVKAVVSTEKTKTIAEMYEYAKSDLESEYKEKYTEAKDFAYHDYSYGNYNVFSIEFTYNDDGKKMKYVEGKVLVDGYNVSVIGCTSSSIDLGIQTEVKNIETSMKLK